MKMMNDLISNYKMMKNILVTLDLDDQEKLLIDKAFELAKPFEAKIWLLHIAAPEPDFVGYEVGPQYIRDARSNDLRKEHKLIQQYTKELQGKGISAEGLLIQGATIEMIMEESEKLNIDLIIAGHHDRSFFFKAFVGSVSSQLIKRSKIPVLTIPI
jgi:nucleotide-binding universal stress UspA family protein